VNIICKFNYIINFYKLLAKLFTIVQKVTCLPSFLTIDILTHFFLHNTYTEKRNQRKKRDEEKKYYKIAPVYILCKKSVSKYHFSSFFYRKLCKKNNLSTL
jgi:hypothetical protein